MDKKKCNIVQGLKDCLEIINDLESGDNAFTCDERREMIENIEGQIEDAICYLESETPKLMTIDEVINLKDGTMVFLETKGWVGEQCCGYVEYRKNDLQSYASTFEDVIGVEYVCDNANYNANWRCWNVYPTKSERKNAPW